MAVHTGVAGSNGTAEQLPDQDRRLLAALLD